MVGADPCWSIYDEKISRWVQFNCVVAGESEPEDRDNSRVGELLRQGFTRMPDVHPWAYGGDGPMRNTSGAIIGQLYEKYAGKVVRTVPVPHPDSDANPPWGPGHNLAVLVKDL